MSPRRSPRPLLATGLTACLTTVLLAASTAAPAGAEGTDPGAAASMSLTKTDPTGDVHRASHLRRPGPVAASIDLSRVAYRLDQAAQTLTITYRITDVYDATQAREARARQLVSTSITPPGTDQEPYWIDSTTGSAEVRVTTTGGSMAVCPGARATVQPRRNLIRQQVPLTCVVPDEGHLASGTWLLTNRGPAYTDPGSWSTRPYRLR